MIYAIICGAIGGAIMGVGGVYGDSFANNGVLTFATYAAFGMKTFIYYLVGVAVSFFGAMGLTYLFGFDDINGKTGRVSGSNEEAAETQDVLDITSGADILIGSPVEGTAVPMTSVNDEVFSSMALGNGIAIVPEKGEVVAPEDCTVTLVYPTLHALGLMLDSGAEMIIHVGINTVQLEGKYFEKHVEEGAHVSKGTRLLSFDIEALEKEGYDTVVPIIISNTAAFREVTGITGSGASLEKPVIAIKNNQ